MNELITCVLAFDNDTEVGKVVKNFCNSGTIAKIILVSEVELYGEGLNDAVIIRGNLGCAKTLFELSGFITTSFTLLCTKALPFELGQNALHRMVQVCACSGAGMVYSCLLYTSPSPRD